MEQIKPIEGQAVYTPPLRSSKLASTDGAPQSVKDVTPQFVSPKGSIDPKSGVFVTEVRDTGTGKVAFQYPSKKAVAAYSRARSTEQAQQAPKAPEAPEAPEQSNASGGKAESNPKVASSALAGSVTDGTTGQEQE